MRGLAGWCVLWLMPAGALCQERGRFEMPVTVSAGYFYSPQSASAPRNSSAVTMGARLMAYPAVRLGGNWSAFGAVQFHTRPYFYEQLSAQGYGFEGDLLQAWVAYDRAWDGGAFSFKAGQLLPAFGAFLLRYDDMRNPLVDMPLMYGYYYRPVTTLGMPGAQIDVSAGRFDGRVQFTASSPANRRGLGDGDQYGNWAGGVGVTLATGIRAGASVYRGPYLHREHRFYRPGEIAPRELPATGLGLDVQAARGRWSFHGELQRHLRGYRAMPTLAIHTGYAEAAYTINPRLYVAARTGIQRGTQPAIPSRTIQEMALGYRLGRAQTIKISYEIARGRGLFDNQWNVFAIQWVATFDGPSF
ncbi:MAG: hypothetical protein R2729_24820 [Bryobacteraceae bacterium]